MTLIQVEVSKAVRAPVPPLFVRRVVSRAARIPEIAARLPEGDVTVAIRITDDDDLERLNSAYAGEQHPTDVLAFAGWDGHLGDIAVSWPAVVRQAREYREDAWSELALLCVHGLLHLLGWDHASPTEHAEMKRLTLVVLRRSHIKLPRKRL